MKQCEVGFLIVETNKKGKMLFMHCNMGVNKEFRLHRESGICVHKERVRDRELYLIFNL